MRFLKLTLLSLGLSTATFAQTITTIAGTGTQGYSGDGGPALAANVHASCIALDKENHHLYISQPNEHVIRKLDLNTGIISTYAGTGAGGYSGDGGAAISAQLDFPESIAVSRTGDLYVFDNLRVRKIDKFTGVVTTIAGTGTSGFSGDGGDALAAQFTSNSVLAVDTAGNILVGDAGNFRIRKIDAATNTVTTVAGTGVWGLAGDGGPANAAEIVPLRVIHVDRHNNIFLSMSVYHMVRKIDAVTGIITKVAGGAPLGCAGDGDSATLAPMTEIRGVYTDNDDNLYLSDWWCQVVRKVDAATQIIFSIAGTGTAGYNGDGGSAINAQLNYNGSIAIDSCGNIYICDEINNRIRKIQVNNGCDPTAVSGIRKEVYSLYPNPATSSLTLTSDNELSDISVYDAVGKLMFTSGRKGRRIELDITGLPGGIYFIHALRDGKKMIEKFVRH